MSESDRQLALVTGGAYGFGLALSRHLLATGYDVLACGRTEARLEDAQAREPDLRVVRADITDADDLDRLCAEVLSIGKPLDLLVNNAGVSFACDYTSVTTLSRDLARAEIETNFAAPVELTRRFLWMRREQGWEDRPATIANIGTPGALFPLEPNPLYSASKAGFHMFTMGLRRQLDDTPVTVVEVYPPLLDTGLGPDLDNPGKEQFGDQAIDRFARFTVDGILAGEHNIHPAQIDFVADLVQRTEAVADQINPYLGRADGWEESVVQRQSLPFRDKAILPGSP
ncbi:MAG: SDR family NAD(P)-dependent oxidoreductase [bacterium]|nr:SDR family NAD(P)-dependent oxidoreductase [bacterium]